MAYQEAEERASRVRLGVWQVPGSNTRPWDFRRGRRSAVIPAGTTPRVAALLVATETSRRDGLPADVVD